MNIFFLKGSLKQAFREARSFLLLWHILSPLLILHSPSSLSYSEVENIHTKSHSGFSEPCVPTHDEKKFP